MEASTAAAKMIEDYRSRNRRFGSQKAPQKPNEAKARRPGPILLVPPALVLLAASPWWMYPAESKGYATMGGRPLPNARVVLTSEGGEVHTATTDENGDFRVSVPRGVYEAAVQGSDARGPKGLPLKPGDRFRLQFSAPRG